MSAVQVASSGAAATFFSTSVFVAMTALDAESAMMYVTLSVGSLILMFCFLICAAIAFVSREQRKWEYMQTEEYADEQRQERVAASHASITPPWED